MKAQLIDGKRISAEIKAEAAEEAAALKVQIWVLKNSLISSAVRRA